jgi:hypothetical protein
MKTTDLTRVAVIYKKTNRLDFKKEAKQCQKYCNFLVSHWILTVAEGKEMPYLLEFYVLSKILLMNYFQSVS